MRRDSVVACPLAFTFREIRVVLTVRDWMCLFFRIAKIAGIPLLSLFEMVMMIVTIDILLSKFMS